MDRLRYLGLLGFCVLVGCKSDAGPLTPVSGNITFDGKPLAGARVLFIPVGDTLGHGGSGVTRDDGGYEIIAIRNNNRKGLLPGAYKVTLSRVLRGDGSPLPPDVPQQGSDAVETIPEQYCKRDLTPFSATITADAKTFDFVLTK